MANAGASRPGGGPRTRASRARSSIEGRSHRFRERARGLVATRAELGDHALAVCAAAVLTELQLALEARDAELEPDDAQMHLELYKNGDPEQDFGHFEDQRETNIELLRGLPADAGSRKAKHRAVGEITLSQFTSKGKWVVLFSHPYDFTPVCSTEFLGFAKRADEFAKRNVQLIGLSIDSVFCPSSRRLFIELAR